MTAVSPETNALRAAAAGSSSIADVRLVELPRFAREDGEIIMAQTAAQVPFPIVRMFTIRAPAGAVRGKHAHRLCSQFMICVAGAVEVACADGSDQRTFSLDRGNLALLVPPAIWNAVTIRKDDSVLAVLCNRPYEENDYIRDYSEFLTLRGAPRR